MDNATASDSQAPGALVDDVRLEKGDVQIDSVTLTRLLMEVRNEDTFEPHAYNRMHNRHNR